MFFGVFDAVLPDSQAGDTVMVKAVNSREPFLECFEIFSKARK